MAHAYVYRGYHPHVFEKSFLIYHGAIEAVGNAATLKKWSFRVNGIDTRSCHHDIVLFCFVVDHGKTKVL